MSWLRNNHNSSRDEEAAQRRAFVERLQQVLEFRPGATDPIMALSEAAPPAAIATHEYPPGEPTFEMQVPEMGRG